MLYSNKIINGTFQKLLEIHKERPMVPISLFEIKNNYIGVSWEYDDVEEDDSLLDCDENNVNSHKNDGLIIYLVDNNQIKEKKNYGKKSCIWKIFFCSFK